MSMQMFLSNGLQVVKLSFKGLANDNKRSSSLEKHFLSRRHHEKGHFHVSTKIHVLDHHLLTVLCVCS